MTEFLCWRRAASWSLTLHMLCFRHPRVCSVGCAERVQIGHSLWKWPEKAVGGVKGARGVKEARGVKGAEDLGQARVLFDILMQVPLSGYLVSLWSFFFLSRTFSRLYK